MGDDAGDDLDYDLGKMMSRSPRPLTPVGGGIYWRSLAERMAGALTECAQEQDTEGRPCWCAIPSMIPYRGHDVGCEAARAALAEYDAAKGGR